MVEATSGVNSVSQGNSAHRRHHIHRRHNHEQRTSSIFNQKESKSGNTANTVPIAPNNSQQSLTEMLQKLLTMLNDLLEAQRKSKEQSTTNGEQSNNNEVVSSLDTKMGSISPTNKADTSTSANAAGESAPVNASPAVTKTDAVDKAGTLPPIQGTGRILEVNPTNVDQILSQVRAGDTVVFADGHYEPFCIPPSAAGTDGNPTIFKSATPGGAIINGVPGDHGIKSNDNVNNLVVDGFEVANAGIDGIKLYGDNNIIRNNYVHGSGGQGIASHGYDNVIIEGNTIVDNGSSSRFDHGIYAGGNNLTIRDNIVKDNASYGIQLWPLATNSTVENNTISGNPSGAVVWGGYNNVSINNDTTSGDPANSGEDLTEYGIEVEELSQRELTKYRAQGLI